MLRFWSVVVTPLLALVAFSTIGVAGDLAKKAEEELDIHDDGHFFSADAIKAGNLKIREIEKAAGVIVRIHTIAEIPADKIETVKNMSTEERGKFFHALLKKDVAGEKGSGIELFVCRKPSHLRIEPFGDLKKRGYSEADQLALKTPVLEGFKKEHYDATLANLLSTIQKQLPHLKKAEHVKTEAPKAASTTDRVHSTKSVAHEPAPAPARAPGGGGWGGILPLLLIVVAAVLVFRVIGSMLGGGGGMGMGGGGGGMMGGFLSGMFGAVAGNWLYNSFLGGGSAHAEDYGRRDADDSSSSGRDDTSDGGGDFGSDDSGDSGDSGGGDFGDSGGDFGGGGGDGGGDF